MVDIDKLFLGANCVAGIPALAAQYLLFLVYLQNGGVSLPNRFQYGTIVDRFKCEIKAEILRKQYLSIFKQRSVGYVLAKSHCPLPR